MTFSVILDTSFLIHLLSENDRLHKNALCYFKYFLENNIPMYISTVSIAEYCVDGEIVELPLRNLRVVPFNFQHAIIAGKFAKVLFEAKNTGELEIGQRKVIPNDVKIFAQADYTTDIKYFVTSDVKSAKMIKKLSDSQNISFSHMDISIPYNEQFGVLDMSVRQ